MLRSPALFVLISLVITACGDDDAPPTDADGGIQGRDAALPMNEPCTEPGALEDVPCGFCGTARRFCTAAGVWEYAACEGESGACEPGASRTAACGACGSRREICTASCTWEAATECESEGTCEPGEIVRTRDGCSAGQRDLRCSDACTFEPISECEVETCETPGATESVSCGMCGTRERFCTAAGEWEYGPCEGQGGCMPGTSQTEACGFCGEQTVRCNASCEWVPSGECGGEGECAPGTTTSRACEGDRTQPFTCSAACTFEPSGECSAPTGGGALGERCVAGTCDVGLTCDESTGIDVCRAPCTGDEQCVSNAFCLGGDGLCSDACTAFTDAGCPAGAKCDYLGDASSTGASPMMVCSAVGSGRANAVCSTNSQCARGFSCVVETGSTTGRCTQVCDATHPCPSGQTCSGGTGFPFPLPGVGLGFCG
ncbi:hypothetical protein [Sandaracinus amylolyticus]|uniref:hypothetical protein n=1 Tax=Sandaracinus amylolyticus TaxID=927083 RepID=UPI001F3FA512|nr:hypothetical protein [Sandaracinus amylolyticus]UJR85580.1 Hypothetical protein I5071_76600 [Sandaracinus amylolyticus]